MLTVCPTPVHTAVLGSTSTPLPRRGRAGVACTAAAPHAPDYCVYDGVFGEEGLGAIDQHFADDAAAAAEATHRVLCRGDGHGSPVGPLEEGLESVLTALDDDSRYVEYWWRDEWIHLDAHRDVDELLVRTDGPTQLRCPDHGHVLYLALGVSVSVSVSVSACVRARAHVCVRVSGVGER